MNEVPSTGSSDFVELWVDAAGEWRWTRKTRSGEVVDTSGEGYVDKQNAAEAAARVNPGVALRLRVEDDADEDDAVQ